MQGAKEEIVHQALLAETHLVLGWMHVDIHPGRIEFQIQHERGVTPMKKHVGISLTHGVGNDAIAHQSTVDVEILRVGLGARRRRQTDPTGQMQAGHGVIDAQALCRKLLTQHLGYPLHRGLFVTGRFPDAHRLAVVAEPELHRAAGQRQRLQQVVDVREFGALDTQEFSARRHVVEQIAHFHAGARRMLRRTRGLQLAAIHFDAKCSVLPAHARGQREARDRRHRGQRLAAKTHAGDVFQIVEAANLAGRMRGHRQRQFVGTDTATIVAHPDQPAAALFDIHFNARGARIEAVLDQLLDHRGRTLDDFASGDLVDEFGG
jgi:hypothetical protein